MFFIPRAGQGNGWEKLDAFQLGFSQLSRLVSTIYSQLRPKIARAMTWRLWTCSRVVFINRALTRQTQSSCDKFFRENFSAEKDRVNRARADMKNSFHMDYNSPLCLKRERERERERERVVFVSISQILLQGDISLNTCWTNLPKQWINRNTPRWFRQYDDTIMRKIWIIVCTICVKRR